MSDCRGALSGHVLLTFLTSKGSQRQMTRLARLCNESKASNAATLCDGLVIVIMTTFMPYRNVVLFSMKGTVVSVVKRFFLRVCWSPSLVKGIMRDESQAMEPCTLESLLSISNTKISPVI